MRKLISLLTLSLSCVLSAETIFPFEKQLSENISHLTAKTPTKRYQAAERLGLMRAYDAAGQLVQSLDDSNFRVRMQSAQALAVCGGRDHIPALIRTLDDSNWNVRQAAAIALQNISAQQFEFDATASATERSKQKSKWVAWHKTLKTGVVPSELAEKVNQAGDLDDSLKVVRALGALGGKGASKMVVTIIEKNKLTNAELGTLMTAWKTPQERMPYQVGVSIVQAGLRSLGRLKKKEGFNTLVKYLDEAHYVRFAADALGEFGDPKAVPHLLRAFARREKSYENWFAVNRKEIASGGAESINDNSLLIMGALCPIASELCHDAIRYFCRSLIKDC